MSNMYKHFEQYLECKYSKCYYAFHLKNDFLAPCIFLIQSYAPFGLNLYFILFCVILNNQAILETVITPSWYSVQSQNIVISILTIIICRFLPTPRVSDRDVGAVDPQVGQRKLPTVNLLHVSANIISNLCEKERDWQLNWH